MAASQPCPRCAGPLFRDVEQELTCLFCGEHLFPGGPTRRAVELLVADGPRKRGRPRKVPLWPISASR